MGDGKKLTVSSHYTDSERTLTGVTGLGLQGASYK